MCCYETVITDVMTCYEQVYHHSIQASYGAHLLQGGWGLFATGSRGGDVKPTTYLMSCAEFKNVWI